MADQTQDELTSERLAARLSELMQSRRDFITKTLGAAAGAAAAYAAPTFTSINAKPAYASITGVSPTATPTEEPTVPTTNSASMFMGYGEVKVPDGGSPGRNLLLFGHASAGGRQYVTANVGGVAGGLAVVLYEPVIPGHTLDFVIKVGGLETPLRCVLTEGDTQADSGANTAAMPAVSTVEFRVNTAGTSAIEQTYNFRFGWYWREI